LDVLLHAWMLWKRVGTVWTVFARDGAGNGRCYGCPSSATNAGLAVGSARASCGVPNGFWFCPVRPCVRLGFWARNRRCERGVGSATEAARSWAGARLVIGAANSISPSACAAFQPCVYRLRAHSWVPQRPSDGAAEIETVASERLQV
jgi:hypothetical protein